jgi:hypothetical protein
MAFPTQKIFRASLFGSACPFGIPNIVVLLFPEITVLYMTVCGSV